MRRDHAHCEQEPSEDDGEDPDDSRPLGIALDHPKGQAQSRADHCEGCSQLE